jgi:hypothetical protein
MWQKKVGLSRLAPNGRRLCGTLPRYSTRSTRVSWVVTWSSCSCRVRRLCRAASCEAAKQTDKNRQVTPAIRCTRYQAAFASNQGHSTPASSLGGGTTLDPQKNGGQSGASGHTAVAAEASVRGRLGSPAQNNLQYKTRLRLLRARVITHPWIEWT